MFDFLMAKTSIDLLSLTAVSQQPLLKEARNSSCRLLGISSFKLLERAVNLPALILF